MRIGFLTSGGDCQGLNPAMRGVAKTLLQMDPETEIFGFLDGYAGLMRANYRKMKDAEFSGILTLGGTILGTSRQPYKSMNEPLDPHRVKGPTKLEAMVQTYKDLALDGLVVLGGNGSLKSAHLLYEQGLNVVGMPKTIDNDLGVTEKTFGFDSAIRIATEVIDCIHTTATSHGRVFIVEIMGHKVGWLTLYAGLAGGADIILLPEIPYSIPKIVTALRKRAEGHKSFSIIAMAEGAKSIEEAELSNKELDAKRQASPYKSIAYQLEAQLQQETSQEVRVTIPGHFVRGGQPSADDRVLTTLLGVEAAHMIVEKDFGKMPVVINGKIDRVSIKKAAFSLKPVPLDNQVLLAARATGISFGD